jgi:hypothetical protein
MTGWKLSLTLPGASEEEVARGIAAAQAVFDAAGAIPFEAAAAIFKREGEIEDLSEREDWLVDVWCDAERAAYFASAGKELPTEGCLELVRVQRAVSPQALIFADDAEGLRAELKRARIRLDTGNIDVARLLGQCHMRRIVGIIPGGA